MPDREDTRIGAMLHALMELIAEREAKPLHASYTNYLLAKGENKILQKFGEESLELILASKEGEREAILREAADLLFHLSVLLYTQDLDFDAVAAQLEARRREGEGAGASG